MIRRLRCVLLLSLLGGAAVGQVTGVADAVSAPSGLRTLGGSTAIVWSEHVPAFKLWRLDAAGPGVSVAPIKPPAQLLVYLKKAYPPLAVGDYDNDSIVGVETQGDEIRVAWIEDLPQTEAEREKSDYVPQAFVQASSADLGVTWRVDRSPFRSTMGVYWFYMYAATDDQHAWWMTASDPGAGQLPEILFRTADGGRTWKQADGYAGSDDSHGMPIGNNGGQILVPKDATHAWFISTCAGCDYGAFLNAAYTDDGGQSWQAAKLPQQYPECTQCYPSDITRAPRAAGDCFDVSLRPPGDDGDHRRIVPVHFCSYDGGHTWDKPLPGMTVQPKEGFHFREGWCGQMTYARGYPELGMTVDFVERPADDGHKTDWVEERLLETRDGGHTWVHVMPELKESITRISSLQASGDVVWLMLDEGANARILLSRDRGVTWQKVLSPAAVPK